MTLEAALAALEDCRRRIDDFDLQLIEMLNRRTRVVEEIGRIKEDFSMPIYEPRREDEVFRNVTAHNTGPLPPDAVKRIFERIIDEMRTLQRLGMRERREAKPAPSQGPEITD